MTMSPDRGGVFDTLLGLTRRGLGGTAGDGRQFMSWIHYEDFVAAVLWLMDRDDIEGAVNLSAPNPLPNAEFMRILREASGVRLGLPARNWMLEIAVVFMRTESELLLKSRRVVPARLLEQGFQFKYPEWRTCAGQPDLEPRPGIEQVKCWAQKARFDPIDGAARYRRAVSRRATHRPWRYGFALSGA